MEEIGRRLRSAREARGITLQVAEEETKIRRKYLEALEVGREADLPGEVYLKGFLRTYGNYVGLNGQSLVNDYKQAREAAQATAMEAAPVHTPPRQAPPPARAAETTTPSRPAPPAAEPVRRVKAEERAGAGFPLSTVALAMAAVVGLGAVGYYGWKVMGQVKPAPAPQTQAPPVQTPPTTPAPALPEPPKVTMTRGTGEDVLFSVPGAREILLRVEAASMPWMSVTVDGQPKYEGIPTGPMEFKGGAIRARMGHMNGVSVVVNGQRFEKPLEKGPFSLIFTGQP